MQIHHPALDPQLRDIIDDMDPRDDERTWEVEDWQSAKGYKLLEELGGKDDNGYHKAFLRNQCGDNEQDCYYAAAIEYKEFVKRMETKQKL